VASLCNTTCLTISSGSSCQDLPVALPLYGLSDADVLIANRSVVDVGRDGLCVEIFGCSYRDLVTNDELGSHGKQQSTIIIPTHGPSAFRRELSWHTADGQSTTTTSDWLSAVRGHLNVKGGLAVLFCDQIMR